MNPRGFLLIAAALLAAPAPAAPKRAAAADEAVLAAYAAFRAGDPIKLARHAKGLEGHALAPYAEYWQLKLRLEDAPAGELEAYLQRHAGSYLAEQLRADWLKDLGRRGEWQKFEQEHPPLVRDDLELRCYAWQARLARGEASAYQEAHALWREPKELPEGCVSLAEAMIQAGRVASEDIWHRVRLLFAHGRLSAARRALGHLPREEAPSERLLAQATATPQTLLAKPPRDLERRANREMLLVAVLRLARSDLKAAVDALRESLAARLPAADAHFLWGRLGYEAARRHHGDALEWFRLAEQAQLSDEQLAWKARAGLRAADWQAVRDAIDPMSAAARRDPAWSYWYGRALGAQGNLDGARAYFLRVAWEPDFYGLLAAEELGGAATLPEPFHTPAEDEVEAARRNPGLARALELFRLNLRPEATREWVFTVRNMDDTQLLAAAELARRASVYDRAIQTANRTLQQHNFKLRFLAPFREVFARYAQAFDLEEAWVLGVVRQESRFIVDARSSAGALGLMQLMPATARWVAARIGLNGYSPARVTEVGTNVTLGTRYLKFVLDDLGHPLLASAAYNAGPGRARRWRDARPLEGAVYAETIPFDETRNYVKRVMANTVYYSLLNGGGMRSLKERLGVVPAKSARERFNEDLP
jgi:soluble lytic murein transglycosylase